MKITIAQLNPVVGDIDGNISKIEATLSQTKKDMPDLVVFPELFLTGYPPRDLLDRAEFLERTQTALKALCEISRRCPQTGILFGTVLPTEKKGGKRLHNSAVLAHKGEILFKIHKSLLPTYDVFDEARYFVPSSEIKVIAFQDETLGISICEDMWNEPAFWSKGDYTIDPIEELAQEGATMFINISASPFQVGKEEVRYRLARSHVQRHRRPFLLVNQVGGNDELIFDGRSFCLDQKGKPVVVFPAFKEQVQTVDTSLRGTPGLYVPQDKIESVYEALVLGIRDYMSKCGFSRAVLGLSGGIDSALTCCLAVEALGSKNVLGVAMPSPYSSRGSLEDASKLASNLGIELKLIPISSIYSSYLDCLESHFAGKEQDVTEENIQARIRGNILMALSNKFGYLVLSTGNKSELAVGYCTLYGDMSGGLAVLSDVPKTMVYELARYANRNEEIIPIEILQKPPSAELRPNQVNQDTLPPYDILDKILSLYLEESYTKDDIVRQNIDRKTVEWVIRAVNRNEYKRRQAAPGLKVTSKAFGMGRRMPIAAKLNTI